VENGAIYITSKNNLLKFKNRLSGRIGLYEMPEFTFFEIDEVVHWKIAKNIFREFIINEIYGEKLKKIKVLAFDVDGVFTDGGVYCSREGEELLKFNRLDGKGIERAINNGLDIWIISSENSDIIKKRFNKLGVKNLFLGINNKLELIKDLSVEYGIKPEEISFMGDDIQDLDVLLWCGFSASPIDAIDYVKMKVDYVCKRKGGCGAVRELIDLILKQKEVL
ncbi:MAG: acylneuraminate cytidylyltransferase, partial [Candidatus Helarchaeota archaeon]